MEYNSYVISSEGKNIETDYISEDTTGKVYRTNNIYASPANGRLYLSSTAAPQMYLKYRTLDYTLADNGMSSEQWVGYRIIDKNSKVVALFNLDVYPDGKIGAFVRAGNYNSTTSSAVSGYMGVFAHKDGSVSYSISHKDKFREAIEVYSKLETETPIRSYLTSTVGHTCKNQLDLSKYVYSSGISNIVIDEATGSLSFTGVGTNRGVNFIAADLGVEMYDKTYTVSCVNNLASTTSGRLAIRKRTTNTIFKSTSLSTTGEKSITFTPDEETFPDGWYISVMATGSTSTTGNIDISNFMLRDASIVDDTFEPYQIPTDERIAPMMYSPINHNGIYRGKDLTHVYTIDEIHNRVQNGSFDDLYLGDYFTVSITTDLYTKFSGSSFNSGTTYYERSGFINNWTYTTTADTSYDSSKTYYTKATVTEDVSLMIAHFNYYTDARFTEPHIILTNRNYGFVTTAKMNPTSTTVGGYYNSEMHQTTLPCYAISLYNALNNHLVAHDSLLTDVVDVNTPSMAGAGKVGASTSMRWGYGTALQLMTEQQLVGSRIWTSSAYDVGCDGNKLAVFNFISPGQYEQGSFWLRTIASKSEFACYGDLGYGFKEWIEDQYASYATHVRPLIVFG